MFHHLKSQTFQNQPNFSFNSKMLLQCGFGHALRMYVYMCVCVWVRESVLVYMCMRLCACMFVCAYIYVCVHECVHIYIYVCVFLRVCV